MKENLLVSFSGGETSAYMGWWIWNNWRDKYNMVFVFANTGLEAYETIQFMRKCEDAFGFKVHYIEPVVHYNERKANTHKELPTHLLHMDGEPFEWIIKKHGIPNAAMPHCTRELKRTPIESFAKEYFNGNPYALAIGIRVDEIDRISEKKDKRNIVYPLIVDRPMTKQKINFWWSQQPFRLELKGYQGNCLTCWKKSDRKLYQISKEQPYALNFMGLMESRYGHFTPDSRLKLIAARGEDPKYPITFFRKNRSAHDIFMESKNFNGNIADDHQDFDDESCELFSNCGDN